MTMLKITSTKNVSGGISVVSDMSGDRSTRIESMPPNILACDSAVLTSFVIPGYYFQDFRP
jgi:hypothetical protein